MSSSFPDDSSSAVPPNSAAEEQQAGIPANDGGNTREEISDESKHTVPLSPKKKSRITIIGVAALWAFMVIALPLALQFSIGNLVMAWVLGGLFWYLFFGILIFRWGLDRKKVTGPSSQETSAFAQNKFPQENLASSQLPSSSEVDDQLMDSQQMWETVPGQDPAVYPQPIILFRRPAKALFWMTSRKYGAPSQNAGPPPHEGTDKASRGWYPYLIEKQIQNQLYWDGTIWSDVSENHYSFPPPSEDLSPIPPKIKIPGTSPPVLLPGGRGWYAFTNTEYRPYYFFWDGEKWGAWRSKQMRFALATFGICIALIITLFTINGLGGFDKDTSPSISPETTALIATVLSGTSKEGEPLTKENGFFVYEDSIHFPLPASDLPVLAANISEKQWYDEKSLIQLTTWGPENWQYSEGSCAPYLRDIQQLPPNSTFYCELLVDGNIVDVKVDTYRTELNRPSEITLYLDSVSSNTTVP